MSGTPFHRFLGIVFENPIIASTTSTITSVEDVTGTTDVASGRFYGVDDDPQGSNVVVRLDPREDLFGPVGFLEGGIVSTLIDVAGASACARAFGGGPIATEHISCSFLAPGRVGPFRATGAVLRAGKRDSVAEVRVVDAGAGNRLMAVGLVTVRKLGT